MEMPSLNDIKIVEIYLGQALESRWFMPAWPPLKELEHVRNLFLVSLVERTRPPEKLLGDINLVMLRHLYVCVPGEETPSSFIAVVRLLHLLGGEERMIGEADGDLGLNVLATLRALQDPEARISVVHAKLGIHLN